jgi:type IV secretion system protein TrbB
LGIVEIMFDPDGRLWINGLAGGLSDTGKRLSAKRGEAHRACRRRSW